MNFFDKPEDTTNDFKNSTAESLSSTTVPPLITVSLCDRADLNLVCTYQDKETYLQIPNNPYK